jgi:hypothetical protein
MNAPRKSDPGAELSRTGLAPTPGDRHNLFPPQPKCAGNCRCGVMAGCCCCQLLDRLDPPTPLGGNCFGTFF